MKFCFQNGNKYCKHWKYYIKKSDETNTVIPHKDPQWYNQGLQLISCGLLLSK